MLLECYSVERNFQEMAAELEKLKKYTLDQVKKSEDASIVKKIQQFKPLWTKLIQIAKRSESGYFSSREYLQIEIPIKCYEVIRSKSPLGFDDGSYGNKRCRLYIRENNEEEFNKFIELINVIAEEDKEAHEENLLIKQHNLQVEKSLFDLFDQIGLKKSYYGTKGRSLKQSEIYYSYSSEIRGQIPKSYGDDELSKFKESKIKEFNNLWNKEISKIREERMKKEKVEKEKEQNKKLVLLLAKYDLELEDSWEQLLDTIISKNKYLGLAHYLEKNRNDWNDGYDYAETGLRYFTAESELDNEIENDITSHMYENWDGDGRVFRDCEYNYSVLYGIAADNDPQLYKDYEIVKENVDSDY